jgi:hypothetical protein
MRVNVATDDQGRSARYEYDPGGRLVAVTDHACPPSGLAVWAPEA